ncbi:Phosphatidylglycerol/phosphatidylinositol transfer protein [Taxawa tesnikishii (nom. ined.)]|nr:Phosphatidylglycerol/phosphatidylinositol transfer protein [Dothideales sp. JES 119]
MKFLSVLGVALLSTAVSARSAWSSEQKTLEEPVPVPGDNPLLYCAKPDKDILTIEKVDLTPNPPAAGQTLTIQAKGTFSEDVKEGAKVHLQVKYGLIRIINQEADLCDNIKNVDLECPLKRGKYTVLADVYTKDNDKITCLTATVVFHRGGAVEVMQDL